jgi:uncharacterized membrane protein YeaQ/YmgE (transglycosylase-associated protein family)
MEFAIALGVAGWIILIGGAIVFGVVAQLIGQPRSGYEWLADGLAAGIGALVASELIVAFRTFGPVYDGLALVPAVLGGLLVGAVVGVAVRYLATGTYSDRPISA